MEKEQLVNCSLTHTQDALTHIRNNDRKVDENRLLLIERTAALRTLYVFEVEIHFLISRLYVASISSMYLYELNIHWSNEIQDDLDFWVLKLPGNIHFT